MLNYTKKNINIITLCITLVVCINLFIMLDMCFLDAAEAKYRENIYTNFQEFGKVKRENQNKDVMKLDDTFLQLMQIADIYDENTRAEEIENINESNQTEEIESEYMGTEEYYKALASNWRIEIPKINLIAPIKSGTTQDILKTAVGHFDGSSKWNGNVSLAGHNRGYNCNYFKDIKNLKIGDEIIYYTEQGEKTYKVVVNKIIKQTDWSYIQNTEDNRITLITCVENMAEYRRCVQAVEII